MADAAEWCTNFDSNSHSKFYLALAAENAKGKSLRLPEISGLPCGPSVSKLRPRDESRSGEGTGLGLLLCLQFSWQQCRCWTVKAAAGPGLHSVQSQSIPAPGGQWRLFMACSMVLFKKSVLEAQARASSSSSTTTWQTLRSLDSAPLCLKLLGLLYMQLKLYASVVKAGSLL